MKYFLIRVLIIFSIPNTLLAQEISKFNFQALYSSFSLKTDVISVKYQNNWIATINKGVVNFDSTGNYSQYSTLNSPLPSDSVTSLAEDKTGNIWIGTKAGLAKFNDGSWVIYNTINSGLSHNKIYAVTAFEHKIFIANEINISVFDTNNNTWSAINYPFVSGSEVKSLSYYNGRLYVATNSGLHVFNKSWHGFNTTNSVLTTDSIKSLNISGPYLYLNTVSKGIYYFEKDKMKKLDYDLGPFYEDPGDIPSFAFDDAGTIYMKVVYLDPFDFFFNNNKLYIVKIHPEKFTEVYRIFNSGINYNDIPYILYQSGKIFLIGYIGNSILVYTEPEFSSRYIFTGKNINSLDINNVKAEFINDGSFNTIFEPYYDRKKSLYKVTNQANDTAGFIRNLKSAHFWISGKDENDRVYKAVSHEGTSFDFYPGPLIDDSLPDLLEYMRVFKVDKKDIEKFKTYYYGGGDTTYFEYKIPRSILEWPGNKPRNAMYKEMAPFVDVDGDGYYNPYKGDYPDIKGDQMLWWAFQDRFFRPYDNDETMFFEYHVSAYAYHCPENELSPEVVENTTFYEIKIINRNSLKFKDLFAGIFANIDITERYFDQIASVPKQNYGYFYTRSINGDYLNYDYNGMPPIMSLAILNGPKADENDGIDNNNNGIIDEPEENSRLNAFRLGDIDFDDPHYTRDDCSSPIYYLAPNSNTANEFYNYMRGLKISGDSIRRYQKNCQGGTQATAFEFDGDPVADTGWINIVNPYDVSALFSSGPFSIEPGESKTLEYAIIYTRDSTGGFDFRSAIQHNHKEVLKVQEWFKTRNYTGCTPTYPVDSFKLPQYDELVIYPNPAKDKITIRYSAIEEGAMYTIFDMQGRVRMNGIMNRYPFQEINTSSLETGTYIIRIVDADAVFIRKFVKSH